MRRLRRATVARRPLGPLAALALGALLAAPAARPADRALLDVVRDAVPRVRAAGAAAAGGRGGSDAVQRQYDAGRDFDEALRRSAPVSAGCRPLLAAAVALARGNVAEAEGFDRQSGLLARAGRTRAAAAYRRLARERRRCRPGDTPAAGTAPILRAPASHAVVVGPISVRATLPAGTSAAEVAVDGRRVARVDARVGSMTFRLDTRPGRHTVSLRAYGGSALLGVAKAADVWQLPESAAHARRAGPRDAPGERRLERLRAAHGGYSAVWVHDLRTGRTLASNAEALFPAASTVKLGVLLAALTRFPAPLERSPVGYDLAAVTGWSSNLASNRLLTAIAGSQAAGAAVAQRALRRAGATRSTFTGGYRVGTARPAAPLQQPPLVSGRVTTARDLGRVLRMIHAAALGERRSLRALGLDARRAGVALNLLLSSRSVGDNVGLLRPALGAAYPIAQKHGWLSTARHTAAVVYAPSGPKIVVVLTYDGRGTSLARASALARGVMRVIEPMGMPRALGSARPRALQPTSPVPSPE